MLLGKPKALRWSALLPGLALTAAGLWLMGAHAAAHPHGRADGAAGPGIDAIGVALALKSFPCLHPKILQQAWQALFSRFHLK